MWIDVLLHPYFGIFARLCDLTASPFLGSSEKKGKRASPVLWSVILNSLYVQLISTRLISMLIQKCIPREFLSHCSFRYHHDDIFSDTRSKYLQLSSNRKVGASIPPHHHCSLHVLKPM